MPRKSKKPVRPRGSGSQAGTVREALSNPFEQRRNKKVHAPVLGRDVRGAERNVAFARSKAVEKRKKTLLPEFEQFHKTNMFLDRRIGEKNPQMSQEEKMLARFQRERRRQAMGTKRSRASKFNIDEDDIGEHEMLTHFGTVRCTSSRVWLDSGSEISVYLVAWDWMHWSVAVDQGPPCGRSVSV